MQVKVFRHTLHEHILLMTEQAPYHRVPSGGLEREDCLAISRPSIIRNSGVTRLIFHDRTHALDTLAVDQEGRMCGVHKLVPFGNFLKEGNQFLLCGWVQVKSRLIKKQNSIFMPLFGFHEKNEVERKKPLKPGTSAFELDV